MHDIGFKFRQCATQPEEGGRVAAPKGRAQWRCCPETVIIGQIAAAIGMRAARK
jgi:hypothetical protein